MADTGEHQWEDDEDVCGSNSRSYMSMVVPQTTPTGRVGSTVTSHTFDFPHGTLTLLETSKYRYYTKAEEDDCSRGGGRKACAARLVGGSWGMPPPAIFFQIRCSEIDSGEF